MNLKKKAAWYCNFLIEVTNHNDFNLVIFNFFNYKENKKRRFKLM